MQVGRADMNRLKALALRVICFGLRQYFRYFPGAAGKVYVWEKFAHPYVAWRHIPLEARAAFGAKFEGALPDTIHKFLYFFGVWEPAVTALYREVLREGDTVVDVGANVGAHALLAASLVGPSGQVHAVEASPWIHQRLLRNLETNGVQNVRTYNMAATDVPGQVAVFLTDTGNLGGTTIVAAEAALQHAEREAVVEGCPLPEIVSPEVLLAARLIKIDVEGAEALVVAGMRHLLPSLKPDATLLVEITPRSLASFGMSLDDFLAAFTAAGFRAYEMPNSYDPRDYIRPVLTRPMPFRKRDAELLDLMFRRDVP